MSNIVERLRAVAAMDLRTGGFLAHTLDTAKKAAAEIERLTGEMSYLSDEVIPALKGECERMQAENERLRKIEAAARNLSDCLDGGFVRCRRCGDQEDTTDLDFAPELREALRINQQTLTTKEG